MDTRTTHLSRRHARPRRLLVAALLAAALTATGCGGDDGSKTSAARKDRFTYARNLFNEICAGCHSLSDAGPITRRKRFNLDEDVMLNRELVFHAIRDGEFGMPAWEGVLSKRAIHALTNYITAVAKRHEGETGWADEHERRAEGEPPGQVGGEPY